MGVSKIVADTTSFGTYSTTELAEQFARYAIAVGSSDGNEDSITTTPTDVWKITDPGFSTGTKAESAQLLKDVRKHCRTGNTGTGLPGQGDEIGATGSNNRFFQVCSGLTTTSDASHTSSCSP